MFDSIEEVRERLAAQDYVSDARLATVVFLATRLGKPILVEGPAGVGKTELAKSLAGAAGRDLIRLQCYEGLDEAKALYEWEYSKQLLYTQVLREKIGEVLKPARDLQRGGGDPARPGGHLLQRELPGRASDPAGPALRRVLRAPHRRDRPRRRGVRGVPA